MEVIKSLTNTKLYPVIYAEKIEVVYSDSAKAKCKLIAKEFKEFDNVDRPYLEFPKGIEVQIYDSALNIQSIIKAMYAIYYRKEELWIARNNVEAKNLQTGEQINSEEMFWNQVKKKVYSAKFTKIVSTDGILYSEGGFESNESLTHWRLIGGTRGTVNVKDNEAGNVQKNP